MAKRELPHPTANTEISSVALNDPPASESGFDPDSLRRMRDMMALGLTPSLALDLLTHLIGEIPTASKADMDRLKMLDKFLNTARAMMETRLKTEEAAAIAARLDEMERRMAAMAAEKLAAGERAQEVWDDRLGDG